jgi:hypothetical protein
VPVLNIAALRKPQPRYRVDKDPGARFETDLQAKEEDATRARLLSSTNLPRKYVDEARELAKKLVRERVTETLASKRWMRALRRNVIGAVLELVEAASPDVSVAVVIPLDWSCSAKELMQVDPRRLLAAFRAALYRCGARDADGWLIAFIHGDFNPDTKLFQLHLHIAVAGEMREVLRRVGRQGKFRSERPGRRKQGQIYQKVWVTSKPLYRPAYALTYLLKSMWSLTRVGVIGDLGGQQTVNDEGNPQSPRCTRHRMPGRIPEPHHSAMLLWLNRQRLQDITLLVKLSVTKNGLALTKPATPRKRKR